MAESKLNKSSSAYVAIQERAAMSLPFVQYIVQLSGQKNLFQSIKEGDWVLVVNEVHIVLGIGRVYRQRSDLNSTTLYFDKYQKAEVPVTSSLPAKGQISRSEWTAFSEAVPSLFGKTLAEVPLIGINKEHKDTDAVYVRELLQLAVTDDLLGPANGPVEQIFDMSVRDRYLVCNGQVKQDTFLDLFLMELTLKL